MVSMQNMYVIWNAGLGHMLKSVRARVLEMSGIGGSRKVQDQRRYGVFDSAQTTLLSW